MKTEDLILKLESNEVLSEKDFVFFVELLKQGVDDENITNFLQKFASNYDAKQCYYFAKALSECGTKLKIKTQKLLVDKNSTGGYSDVISLIVAPVIASFGFAIPRMTCLNISDDISSLDRLKLFNGIKTDLSQKTISSILDMSGLCFFQKPEDVITIEREFYKQLKIAKVQCEIPYLAILTIARKMVLGIKILALDIRCGEASIVKTMLDAENLGNLVLEMGKLAGIKVGGNITYTTQPLSSNLGIRFELKTAIQILTNKKDFYDTELFEICYEIVATILKLAGLDYSEEDVKSRIKTSIDSGFALEKFVLAVLMQNGHINYFDDPELLIPNISETNIVAEKSGYLEDVKIGVIKKVVRVMGGIKDESGKIIDDSVGIELLFKEGMKIKKGATLAKFFCAINNPKFSVGLKTIRDLFVISSKKKNSKNIVKKVKIC